VGQQAEQDGHGPARVEVSVISLSEGVVGRENEGIPDSRSGAL
jgi:hypothetical protein